MKSSVGYALKIGQTLTLNPQLILSVKILAMSTTEIEALVSHELEENPILDEVEQASSLSGFAEFYDGASPDASIQEHLLKQLTELELSEEDRILASELIGNINEDGYLDISIQEFSRTHKIEEKHAERVLDQIQHMQPPGVAARDLKECLLLQLESLHLENSLAAKVISDFFDEMLAHKYKRIAVALGRSEEEILQSVVAIKGLSPRPACNFGPSNTSFALPDVYIVRNGDEYELTPRRGGPKLCINESSKQIYSDPNSGVPKDCFDAYLKSANVVIHALEERDKTIMTVAKAIIEKQKAFLELGLQALVPMKMAEIAQELGLSESTISRSVNNKFIATPHGTLEMKRFFSVALVGASEGDEAVASESVRFRLLDLVRHENKKAPLSDQKIAETFSDQGIRVARRTVAKYREQLGILPASMRKAA